MGNSIAVFEIHIIPGYCIGKSSDFILLTSTMDLSSLIIFYFLKITPTLKIENHLHPP